MLCWDINLEKRLRSNALGEHCYLPTTWTMRESNLFKHEPSLRPWKQHFRYNILKHCWMRLNKTLYGVG